MAKGKGTELARTEDLEGLLEGKGASLSEILAAFKIEEPKPASPKISQSALAREFADASTTLNEEQIKTINALVPIIDNALGTSEEMDLEFLKKTLKKDPKRFQGIVDHLSSALLRIRQVEAILKGRHAGARLKAFRLLDAKVGENNPGVLVSLKEEYRLARDIRTGGTHVDEGALAESLTKKGGKEAWYAVSTPGPRFLDYDKLKLALGDGVVYRGKKYKVDPEMLKDALSRGPETPYFLPDKIKPEDLKSS
jgi:hypothetical protein